MRKIFTFLFLMVCLGVQLRAQDYQVPLCGTSGSTTYGPMYSIATANATNRTAVIYPTDRLSPISGITITDVYFNRTTATGTMAGTPNLKIYFKEVSFTEWPSGSLDWATATTGANLVFDDNPAPITGSSEGWKDFPLSSPFLYSGTQNLAVFFEYRNASASTSISWSYEYLSPCVNTSTTDATKYSNVTTGILPTSLSTTSAYNRPAIAFDGIFPCDAVSGLSISNLTTNSATVNWVAPSNAPADGYEYYYNETGVLPSPATTATGTTLAGVTSYNLTGLVGGITTYFWVRSVCSPTEKGVWSGPIEVNALPPNDECGQAIVLTASATCSPVAGFTVGATASSSETTPGCSATGINDDVWYQFTATATKHTVSLSGTSSTMAAAIYSGSCGSLVAVACASTAPQANNLTIGNVYYVRVYTTSSTANVFSNFNICVIEPPVNDDCNGAISLTAHTGAGCSGATTGTTLGATQSAEAATTCSASGINDDVWYSFVATSAAHTVSLTGTSSTSAVAVYSGTCGNLALVGCASTSATVTGLTSGETYFARVYTTSATVTISSVFEICVTTPPANDECSGSVLMPVTPAGSACTATAVSTEGATQSTTTGQANSCTTTGINDDVWYSFTTTVAGAYAFSYTDLVAVTGTASTVGMNVYTGSCGSLTVVTSACSSGFGTGGSGTFSVNLAATTTYTLRLYVGSISNSGTFNFCINTPDVPPVNNDCEGAIALTASSTSACISPVSGTTLFATQSATADPTCSASGINDDVWYSFAATSSAHTVLITGATNATAAAIYSGTCPSGLTQLAGGCNTGGTTASGLTIGTVYFVRVYTTTATAGTSSNFDICVVSGAPANDECSGAIALPAPSATNSCTASTSGSTAGATVSSEAAPSCSASGINDDVWYSFVATSANHAVLFSNTTNAVAAAVYSGSCGSLTQVTGACAITPDGAALATGLTPGATYYVRIYTTSSVVGTYSDFSFCVISVPANDDCASAGPLTVSTDCSAAVPGSTAGATPTTGETAPTCSPAGANDDVWYSFVATAATHTVSLFNTSATMAASVYSGTCGSLVAVACASTNTIATGLTPGNTYFVRVYSTSNTVGTYGTFTICIGELPSNDDCAGAIPLPASSSCNPVAGTTTGATATTGETAPSCSSSGVNDDVWYSFTATATTHIVSITNASTTTAAAIYSGSCGSLVQVACASTLATATGLTIGDTYYVRVYSTTSSATIFSNFNICVTGIPANDECAAAVALPGGVTVNGSIIGATETMPSEACASAPAAPAALDVWYQFTTLSGGAAVINVTNVASTLDAVVQVYSGSCGAFTNIGCADGPGSGGSETVTLNGLIAGQTYYIRVYGFNSGVGSFSIAVSGAALPVLIEYFNGKTIASGNLIDWKLGSSAATVMNLERSSDGRNFETIYTRSVTAFESAQSFSFLDANVQSALTFYRLKSVETDGSVSYSKTIVLASKGYGMKLVNVVPNPAREQATVNISAAKAGMIQLSIADFAGRVVSTQKQSLVSGTNQVRVSCAHLSSGTYFISVQNEEGFTETIKFVKQ